MTTCVFVIINVELQILIALVRWAKLKPIHQGNFEIVDVSLNLDYTHLFNTVIEYIAIFFTTLKKTPYFVNFNCYFRMFLYLAHKLSNLVDIMEGI